MLLYFLPEYTVQCEDNKFLCMKYAPRRALNVYYIIDIVDHLQAFLNRCAI